MKNGFKLLLMFTGLSLILLSQCKADNPDKIIEDFSSTLTRIKQYDYGKSHTWLEDLQNIMVRVYNNPQTYEKVESLIIDALNSEISDTAKQMICPYLGPIASIKAIPVLKMMLHDDFLSASALGVLQQIPDPAADKTLLETLPESRGLTKIGIINVMGLRKDQESVIVLNDLIFDRDTLMSKAAIASMGLIGNDQACRLVMFFDWCCVLDKLVRSR